MKQEYMDAYVESTLEVVNALFAETFDLAEDCHYSSVIQIEHELIVQIPFYGIISGAYLLSLDYLTAHNYLQKQVGDGFSRELLYSALREVLNTTVGSSFNLVLKDYPSLTFLAPLVFHSPAQFPEMDCGSALIKCDDKYEIGLHLYIDTMLLQINEDVAVLKTEKLKSIELTQKVQHLNVSLQEEKDKSNFLWLKAHDAARLKDQFLAVVSHEMRTPLNAVIGYSSILMGQSLSLEQRDMLNQIKQASDHLLSMINDVLDLTRIESDNIQLESIPFNLEDILFDAARKAYVEMSHPDKVELNIEMSDAFVHLLGDAPKLRHIIGHLLTNAVKFTESGAVLLKVQSLLEDENWSHLLFRVIDTGIGIGLHEKSLIFEPFRQVDVGICRKYQGSGLGLSISKALVEAMGGHLKFKSQLGHGTEFYFELRFRKAQDIKCEKEKDRKLSGANALLIDSAVKGRRILSETLLGFGMKVEEFSSFSQAREALEQKKYDFVFVELLESQSESMQIIKDLKEKYFVKYVIAEGTQITTRLRNSLYDCSCDRFLSKPLKPSLLLSVLRDLYTQRGRVVYYNRLEDLIETEVLEILIVDHCNTNRQILAKVLTRMGHMVDIAENGVVFMEKLEVNHYDIVFMDMYMPVTGSIELVKTIRENERFEALPIIGMVLDEKERATFLDAGVNDIISRPIKRDKIWALLNEFCIENTIATFQEAPRVLIIEEDRVLQKLISFYLKTKLPNVSCRSARSAVDACASLGSFQPHLVLLNIEMANVNGVELLRYMKSEANLSNTGVIALRSSNGNDDVMQELKEMGVDSFIQIPLKDSSLFTEIKNVLISYCK
ncbi:MAG: response regulator [Lentisphaeraceae bacterium]|nr:response regulator [Lentisphaeraceae bacterium]